jgi:hypothetical protein
VFLRACVAVWRVFTVWYGCKFVAVFLWRVRGLYGFLGVSGIKKHPLAAGVWLVAGLIDPVRCDPLG